MQNAMWTFWTRGYHATSIDDLVKTTGVARSGIYAEFGGKEEAFANCLEHYREAVAGPAIAILTNHESGLKAIRAYFGFFIERHRQHGLPGPGCFLANSVTEMAPHSQAALETASAHRRDLQQGFKAALCRAAFELNSHAAPDDLDGLANFLAVASQGLWSYARAMDDIAELEQFAREILALVEARLSNFGDAGDDCQA
ncbi:TetR/AcrR family transcriptional regulator [Erythrobacter sp.]|uniref:TetR/AcrR family transcriptional regulator n=1 Tax=Erythrobacter sp. TaxID=1042 RepID=UPI0025D65867|nr:TetR/AcrR family transcriptional regulator [Erythrobacter sp.]